ncbi:hypothetical protein RchiOBHm_Chr7g0181311 [Rosa chinensis]|uniref:Uncharacterized protein n=1 Tax=Rosa chinensis TaxID=74649 RepID=A0A2P6P2L7_ROSCH|nr:hypothetical protein RchiOBHm_Chr7g0181311 [Rosa chinensis]
MSSSPWPSSSSVFNFSNKSLMALSCLLQQICIPLKYQFKLLWLDIATRTKRKDDNNCSSWSMSLSPVFGNWYNS